MQKLKIIISALVVTLTYTLLTPASFAAPLLNGVATQSELGKEQFIAGLFTSTLASEAKDVLLAQEDKRMQIRVTADRLSTRRFKRLWIEGMAINASSSELQKHAQHMADFSNMLKIKLMAGDIFTIDRAGSTVLISLNGAQLGQIPDPAFFDLLLRTWVGPVPLSSDFKQNMLVAGNVNSGLITRFESTRPTDERIAAVEDAVKARAKQAEAQDDDSTPKVAVAKTDIKPKIEAPVAIAPPPKIAAPSGALGESKTVSTPKPEPAKPKPQEPEPAPKVEEKPKVAAITPPPPETLLDEESLEDEEDDLDFTAESLLSQQLYIAKLKRWSSSKLKYPSRAASRGHEGNVRLSIVIDRSGKVKKVEVIEAAEYSSLTKEAQNAIERANPFPPMPEDVKGDTFLFTLPVVFQLQ
ncbi:TonB family protein [Saccharophagus degradans]|uniref:Protein TonB n=1 Tax=Saccharophagus degradans TaxID=86304 RepID=A0AAW7XC43_9GAMM|nr:TonB family protein [Saccharophagus degradans]MDO6424805.1 TonB family protein [Saccharophagus degradans]MDO6609689.1 TonB family protein [Saccharophagus degradans]